jgi:hypothetical protein
MNSLKRRNILFPGRSSCSTSRVKRQRPRDTVFALSSATNWVTNGSGTSWPVRTGNNSGSMKALQPMSKILERGLPVLNSNRGSYSFRIRSKWPCKWTRVPQLIPLSMTRTLWHDSLRLRTARYNSNYGISIHANSIWDQLGVVGLTTISYTSFLTGCFTGSNDARVLRRGNPSNGIE